jgi:hypothetical protein
MDKAVSQIRAFLLANESRFDYLHEDTCTLPPAQSGVTVNRAGFRRTVGDGAHQTIEYLVTAETLKDICQGYDSKKVAKELHKRGNLRRQNDRLQVQHRVDGNATMRFYAIQSSIFHDGDNDEEENAA